MARSKDKKPEINQNKVELAKTIASQSKKIARSYANVESSFVRAFRWLSSWLDKLLFNRRYSREIALLLAIVLYIAVNSVNSLNLSNTTVSAKMFDNLPVSTEVNTSVYEVTGIPETVTLNLMGDLSDISIASAENQRVVADLTGLGEGVHTVSLKATGLSNRVKAVVEPSSVTVTIAKKISKEFTLGYDFVNTNKMDSIYALDEPVFERDTVIVRASEATIKSISVVKALIDVSNVTADFMIEAPLVAYDQKGDRINVDIVPEKSVVSVKVTTPSKDVPINIIPSGEIPNGKSIASYTLDHSSVTIYGPQEVLDGINQIDIQLPVYDFNSEINSVVMPINLPSGVRRKSVSVVSISVTLADTQEKTIEDVAITYKRNEGSKYKVTIDSEEATYIDVLVKGSSEMLEAEEGNNISVYIDFSEIPEGSNGVIELPLHVTGSNLMLKYELTQKTIRVNVSQ